MQSPTKSVSFFSRNMGNSLALTNHSECETENLRISVERWRMDGTKSPSLIDSGILDVSCADVQWSLYNAPCSRKVSFIPQSTSAINPGTVALLDSGTGLRIGSRILFRNADSQAMHYTLAGSKTPGTTVIGDRAEESTNESVWDSKCPVKPLTTMPEDAATLREYCEEIAHQGNLLVICRRRIPKKETSKKESYRGRNRKRGFPRRGSDSDSSGSGSDGLDSERDRAESETPAFSDRSSLKSRGSSHSLRSISDDSETSDEKSDHESVSGGSNDFDVDSESAESRDGSNSASSLEEAEDTDTDDSVSSSLLPAPSSESSDSEFHDRQTVGDDGLDFRDEYEYPVEITRQPLATSKWCDQCDQYLDQTWYHCLTCRRGNYDVCHQCVKNGEWCCDKEHQLYEEVSGIGVVSVISWSCFVPGQEILIFDTTSTMEKPIFARSVLESTTLHRSAPAIHPLLPLVVWPICAEKLLFVDTSNTNTSKKKCYSEQSFKATSSKGMTSTPEYPKLRIRSC